MVGWSTVADTVIGNIMKGNNDSNDNVDPPNYLITSFENMFSRIISYHIIYFHSMNPYRITKFI